jgi:hypothetical protein
VRSGTRDTVPHMQALHSKATVALPSIHKFVRLGYPRRSTHCTARRFSVQSYSVSTQRKAPLCARSRAAPSGRKRAQNAPTPASVPPKSSRYYLAGLGAVAINGAKAVGKTATVMRRAARTVRLDREQEAPVVRADPNAALREPFPVFFDEWQHVPSLWDAVRHRVDDDPSPGLVLVAGAAAPAARTQPPHTGAGRIVTGRMRRLTISERLHSIPRDTISVESLLTVGERPRLVGSSPWTLFENTFPTESARVRQRGGGAPWNSGGFVERARGTALHVRGAHGSPARQLHADGAQAETPAAPITIGASSALQAPARSTSSGAMPTSALISCSCCNVKPCELATGRAIPP